jgi:hypothetical protein
VNNQYEITPSISYALNLKEWELSNIPYFFDSRITQQLFRSLAVAHLRSAPLRLNEIYIDAGASEVGIRKRIAQCIDLGYITIIENPTDRRSKIIKAEPKFEALLAVYVHATNQLWLRSFGF